jgi:hypothetical protein
MSFSLNKSALEHIKDYDALMDHIKFLSDKDDKYQAETANRILWKVEKESTFILEQKIQEKQKKVVIKKTSTKKKLLINMLEVIIVMVYKTIQSQTNLIL